jgi:hypothetical protein
MPTPPKPYLVLSGEKKSHRTKAELNKRKQEEQGLLTGVALKESSSTKANAVAHKEFTRVNKLLKNIDKNDAIYEGVINRYCILFAETQEAELVREEIYMTIIKLRETFYEATDEFDAAQRVALLIEFSREIAKMTNALVNMDRDLQSKRKMLLDMEKENVMTIASALRSIPKKVDETKDALLEALK